MLKSLGRITIFSIVALTLSTGLFLIAVWTVDDAINYEPTLSVGFFDTSKVTADSLVVLDAELSMQLATKEENQILPIASITKLFSAASFYDVATLTATTTIEWADVNTDGDAGRLKPYQVYGYRELMYPLLLESSNDAATALSRVEPLLLDRMNAFAKDAGATQTHFEDASGLSDKNVSTAHELSLLVQKLYLASPHIFDITQLTQFIGTHTGWMNNNPFVHEEGYKGGKHGFTYEANRTVVAYFDEVIATGQTRTVVYIMLGSDDLKADIGLLRDEVRKNVRLE